MNGSQTNHSPSGHLEQEFNCQKLQQMTTASKMLPDDRQSQPSIQKDSTPRNLKEFVSKQSKKAREAKVQKTPTRETEITLS